MRSLVVKHKDKEIYGVTVSDHYVPEVSADGQKLVQNFLVGVVWGPDQCPAISYHPVGELQFVEFEDVEEEEDDEEIEGEIGDDGNEADEDED